MRWRQTGESRFVVIASIAANIGVAGTKFLVAAITGSVAMMAEGAHSLANCFDGGLLLLGENRARRPPNELHPFGYGRELYFWSFIVAVVFFTLGSGFALYEGIRHVLHPAPLRSPGWNYVVLAASAFFDGASFVVGFRVLRRQADGRGYWTTIRESKNPTLFSTVLEDAADIIGLTCAFVGVYASHMLGMPALDGVASIAIGVLLGALAIVLLVKTHGLLIGESASPELIDAVRDVAQAHDGVTRVGPILTVHTGPYEVVLVMRLGVRPEITAAELSRHFADLERQLRHQHPELRRVFFEVASSADTRA
jgi:cation diffusion facilitator family transporter